MDDVDSYLATKFSSDTEATSAIVVKASMTLVDFEEESIHSTIDLSYDDDVKSDSATTLSSDADVIVVIVFEESPALVDFEEEPLHSTIDLSDVESDSAKTCYSYTGAIDGLTTDSPSETDVSVSYFSTLLVEHEAGQFWRFKWIISNILEL